MRRIRKIAHRTCQRRAWKSKVWGGEKRRLLKHRSLRVTPVLENIK